MPRGDGTGPLDGAGRGRGGGRGMRLGRGPGRRQDGRMRRAGKSDRIARHSNLLRTTTPAESQMLSPANEQTAALRNRDTLSPRKSVRPVGQPAPLASVDETACTLCGACQAVCPTEAITLGDTAVQVNAETCCGCGACVEVCPTGAIRLDASGRL